VGFSAAHGLGKMKDRGSRITSGEVPERPVNQCPHAIGEVISSKKIPANYFSL
jgi:hypothetical protein